MDDILWVHVYLLPHSSLISCFTPTLPSKLMLAGGKTKQTWFKKHSAGLASILVS
jgi:hypothetical protein